MKILVADFIYTPEGYLSNAAVAFTDTIQAIESLENLKKQYPDAEVIETEPNSVIDPDSIHKFRDIRTFHDDTDGPDDRAGIGNDLFGINGTVITSACHDA